MKDLRLRVHVVVKILNLGIPSGCFARRCCCTCSTLIFRYSTNQINFFLAWSIPLLSSLLKRRFFSFFFKQRTAKKWTKNARAEITFRINVQISRFYFAEDTFLKCDPQPTFFS